MEGAGYVRRHVDVHDARAKLASSTARGRRLLATVEVIYADLEAEWATVLGAGPLIAFAWVVVDRLDTSMREPQA